MSFPYSYSVLGLVPGLILTVVIAGLVLYTSLVLWYVSSQCRCHIKHNNNLTQGVLSPPSRSQGRVRYRSNAVLGTEMGLVGHCCHVSSEQYLYPG